ncbi:probable LRR receptor-like serine/threonine-protein kinase At1g56140 [Phalaenopsis equestris]|uniref:probable LRR receptor-like serine/threonine-protein kinase At1g56140 n=1 Tax=Phalaenopsis equestris TaxID=78828 RepID=UPI0009E4D345|nr:probable LRR receptor-like serine/threonine-protein kinase At1g56140 [Phalaenopsis equestris]XP_020580348.1 probable LRR receptor-like serine/threonine-protein kinase At1g56140 [Phalaenopsis equestris]
MNASSAFFLSSVLVLLIVSVLFAVLWRHRKRTLMNIWRAKRFSTNDPYVLPENFSNNLRTICHFDYHTLKRATGNFNPKNQLGKGGFGPVYQGRLDDGRRIAVKQLCLGKSGQGESEFLVEVRMLTSIQHKNLVRLLGCCSEGSHRLVVYEFMKNRSLDCLIYENSEIFLNWKTRFQIILGIARGLQYLHEDSNLRIVHRDIKASNILLNEKFQPKISDFGLARLFPEDEAYLSAQFAGTLGYTAPEYAIKGELSEKADIYSFGVLILEIVCSRKNTDLTLPTKMQYLPEYAWKLYESSIMLDLVDPRLKADGIEQDEVLHVFQVALLCLQPYPSLRPSMSEVVAMLSSKNRHIASPVKPAFMDRKRGIDMEITPTSCEIVSEFFPSPASDSATLPPTRLGRKSSFS